MRFLPLVCCFVLTACTLALPGRDDKPVGPAANPITGDAIATTTLAPAAPGVAGKPVETQPAEAQAAQPNPAQSTPAAKPVAAPVAPARIASPQELACVKKGNAWRSTGAAGGEACFTQTKDAGKSCQRESDCDGYCLARSGTCAPFKPMFGCNEILQDNGVMVTLCID